MKMLSEDAHFTYFMKTSNPAYASSTAFYHTSGGITF